MEDKYMILDQLHHLAIYDKDVQNYSEQLRYYIDSHNNTIQGLSQTMATMATINILRAKNIITDDEFCEEVNRLLSQRINIQLLEQNRDNILSAIEAEREYLQDLKEMHEDLQDREGTEAELSSEAIDEIFEGE